MSGEQIQLQNIYKNNEEQTQPIETSAFFSRHAIWMLLPFWLAAIWYRFIPLIIASTFLLILFIIITIWKKMSLKHVKPSLQLSKSRLFVDEEFQMHASIYNGKWFPLIWLEWVFPKNIGVSLGDSESYINTIRFLWLLWYQKVEWTLNGKAFRRGVYNIGQITLRSGDGFRFAETEQIHDLDGKIYVYPRLVAVNVPDFRPSMQWGAKGKQGGFIEDPLLVVGVREYQAGDELRRFNWRASARTGKLQTNVYQPVVMEQLLIYIDVQGFVINETEHDDPVEQKKYVYKKRKSFEWFLSVIASAAVKYKEKGMSIGFAGNGLSSDGNNMPGILPSTNLIPLLDQLAQITQCMGVDRMVALDKILHKARLNIPLFIFCNHITEGHYMWYQQNKHKLSETCFYYKDETQYSKKLDTVAKQMDMLLSSSASSQGGF